jgi:hypothetical protein
MKPNYQIILIGILLLFVSYLLWERYLFLNTPKQEIPNYTKYFDSITKQNNILKYKIDSLDLLKKEHITYYKYTKLKYDTIQISIDTMPGIDGTKFLLSISRQLTSKGIE